MQLTTQIPTSEQTTEKPDYTSAAGQLPGTTVANKPDYKFILYLVFIHQDTKRTS